MWIVIVSYSRSNETFIYDTLETAKNKYSKVVESGRVAYLANIIESNS